MQLKKQLLLITFGLITASGSALADGYESYAPPPPPVACCDDIWTGPYARAAIGYQWGNSDSFSQFTVDGVPLGTITDSASHSGVQGVVTLGYDHAIWNALVLGVFGDYAFGEHSGNGTLFDPNVGSDVYSAELDDQWSLGGRIGYAMQCCTMLYFSAGWSWSHVTFIDPDNASPIDAFGQERNHIGGYFLGVGVEHQLHDGWFVNLDYRFTDYGNENYVDQTITCGASQCNFRFDLDTQTNALRLGIAWKMDMDRHEVVPIK